MLFSSINFLYTFLPIVLALYFIAPKKFRNFVLLGASLYFYFHGERAYTILMIASSVSGYLHGLWIDRARGSKWSKIAMISSVIFSIGLLGYFKYTDFILENVNWAAGTDIALLHIALPIGISFYTFQILSYTIDVYRGEAKVQRSLLDFMTYVTLFPQLIAGPIVRYTTVQEEMDQRTHSLENFAYGVNRFIIGLSKKVLLANTLGELGQAFAASTDKSVLFYWIMTFAFMLHVYFDFSGYSDMAIGMGRMFGFHFLENFNYPFIAKSIAEFWRRWHISLGTWFRDYVYIPMGGNRVSGLKWVRNTLVVWFLTGFWHGAQWNFVVWGLYFSITLALEKFFIRRFLDKLPAVIRHLYTLFFITLSFVLFNANSMGESLQNFMGMFGLLNIPLTSVETLYFLRSYGVLLIIGVAGATPLMTGIVKRLRHNDTCARILNIVEPILHVVLLLLVTGYMIDGSFNPFIYFRF